MALFINEFCTRDCPDSIGGDYIEIYNSGPDAVNLTQWKISDSENITTITNNYENNYAFSILEPNQFLIIRADEALGETTTDYGWTNNIFDVPWKLGGSERITLTNPSGDIVDEYIYTAHPCEDDTGLVWAREYDGGPWPSVFIPENCSEPTPGASNGAQPILGCTDPNANNYNSEATEDDGSCEYTGEDIEQEPGDITTGQPLNLITIEGKYGIQGITDLNPSNDVISIIYSGKSFQITNDDTVDENGKVKYSVTFDGGDLSEYAVGFNLRTEINNQIVVLRSAEVVPVTNILGGQINYNFDFVTLSDEDYVGGCTDPTATNYESLATLDNNSCQYNITGCSDEQACTCDTCFDLCQYCGTEKEYKCVSEFGFYNQNPNVTGDNSQLCTYPPSPIQLNFAFVDKEVENFEWLSETSDDSFIYTYITENNFNNPILVSFNSNLVKSYSFDLEGLHARECRLENFTTTENNNQPYCELTQTFDGEKTSINVLCQELGVNGGLDGIDHMISCSVYDIIKLHSCIKNPIFFDSNNNQLNYSTSEKTCFDLNPQDDLDTRLIKLNKLNGKMYTQILDLHRGKNSHGPHVLSPFCCKQEWESIELEYPDLQQYCEGTYQIDYDAPATCTGSYAYTCPIPGSQDITNDGIINIQDIIQLVSTILGTSTPNETYPMLYGDLGNGETLCNYSEIMDSNGDGLLNVTDVISGVQKILNTDANVPIGEEQIFNCTEFFEQNNICPSFCNYIPSQTITTEYDCNNIFLGNNVEQGFEAGECPTQEISETVPILVNFNNPMLEDIDISIPSNGFGVTAPPGPLITTQETVDAYCQFHGYDSAYSYTISEEEFNNLAYYTGNIYPETPWQTQAAWVSQKVTSISCLNGYETITTEGGCNLVTIDPDELGNQGIHPITQQPIKHSSELLKCGNSYPALGIVEPDDFYDFDMEVLLDFYNDGRFLEYRNQCLNLTDDNPLHINPTGQAWRGTEGPFRDYYYQAEHLGATVGESVLDETHPGMDTNPTLDSDHIALGPLQLMNVPGGIFVQGPDGTIFETSVMQGWSLTHGYSFLLYQICNSAGANGLTVGLSTDGPALVNDEFCESTIPTDIYDETNPYGWVANSCCENNQVKQSFKIPYYGVIPFFNKSPNENGTNDYYYKYSARNKFTNSQYGTSLIPPCKEYLYEKMTTALSFDETVSDSWQDLGFSYSIQVIEYETELISHVIISGDTLPSIWLGTLTDLRVGEGYTIRRFTPYTTYGSPLLEGDSDLGIIGSGSTETLRYFKLNMEYDNCGICSNGSTLHIPDSEKDDLSYCCLYPNEIKNYYEEDPTEENGGFGTGVGKTYLNKIRLCNDIGETYELDGLIYHNESNSDDCPGTLDCLGVCHEGLPLSEAQLLTTYAQIDKYGGCCLQGDIDLCGVCYGDSTDDGCNPAGFDSVFGTAVFNISNTLQQTPSVDDENINKGSITINVDSQISISEIKFKVVGLNISSGNFLVGSEQPDFEIFTTMREDGTDVVVAPILSNTLFPTIPAGGFQFELNFDNILPQYSPFIQPVGYIDIETIEVYRFNQSIGGTALNTEDLYTDTLTYYGCGSDLAANPDIHCLEDGVLFNECVQTYPGTEQSFCIYTEIDCHGTIGGDSFLNSCNICVEGETGITNTNNLEGEYEFEYGMDCSGTCFGTAFLDDCDVCSAGNTGHIPNSDKDCHGDCFGNSELDECEMCTGGNTGYIAGYMNSGCGCFVPAPVMHYIDNDYDGLGVNDDETNQEYCILHGTLGTATVEIAPSNYSTIFGDLNPVCPLGTQYDCGNNCILSSNQICPGELTQFDPPICTEELVAPYVFDDCGECNGQNSDKDECGVCFGDNSSCEDCNGTPNGTAVIDECGDCTGGTTGNSYNYNMDCAGVCGGTAEMLTYYFDGDGDGIGCNTVSWYGCSNSVPPNYVEQDGEEGDSCNCPDTCEPAGFNIGAGGESCLDECNVCGGENLDKDCEGVCFGDAVIDQCGVCNGTNDCVGCMYPDADNYGGVEITIDDGSCEYDELIRNIYQSPAIYIQGSRVLNFIGFFLPDNISENIQSSQPLVCAGTKGENPDADAYCAGDDITEGQPCGQTYLYSCSELENFFGLSCDDYCSESDCNGVPNCGALTTMGYGWVCQYSGEVCEKYEIHRIMMNSFYSITTNPDNVEEPILGDYINGDELRIISYDNEGNSIDSVVEYNNGWSTGTSNHHFRTGVGYYLKTQNNGWFKITPTRDIFDWEES